MMRTRAMRGVRFDGTGDEGPGVLTQLAVTAALGLGVHAASGWIADALVTLFG